MDTTNCQLILGFHNAGFNNNNCVKLLISGHNNDSATVYPILVEDENGYDDFGLNQDILVHQTNNVF